MGRVSFKILPKNHLSDWGEFEAWAEGVGSAPTGWLIATDATIAKETSDIKFGDASASVTGTASAQGGIYRTIPNGDDFAGRTFKLGAWAKSASTGPFLRISDGVGESTVHLDGLDAFVELTTPALQLDKNATELRVDLLCSSGAACIFDSAVLCEGEDLFTKFDNNIAVSDFRPSLQMKQDSFEISQREGSFVPDNHMKGRPIRMTGSVIGTDPVSARTHFDELLKALLAWQTEEKRNLYIYEDRLAEVFLKSFDWNYSNAMKWINFTVNFTNPEATTKFIGKFRSRTVIAATVQEFNLVYNGNSESRPIVSFVADQGGAITTCDLENMTTGESIVYSGTVPENVALDIDCDKGTVFNSSVNKIEDFGTSDFLKLVKGTNYFRFQGSNCKIHIDWVDRYL